MKKRQLSLKGRENITAHLFLIPFYLGLIFFFLSPLIESVKMSFANVSIELTGYKYDYIGFENYKTAFFTDADFVTNIVTSVTSLLWQVPTINIFAIFLALIINQKFKGRLLVRAIFFMPLIFASGVAFSILQGDYVAQSAMAGASVSTSGISNTGALKTLLANSGVGSQIINIVTKITTNIFSMAWASGVQMLLYLAALQSISPALYEASKIEGASTWDNFWKITLPMLLPIMLVCFIYTVVDTFTSSSNIVMEQIMTLSSNDLTKMGLSSSFSWVYFMVILVILALILLLFRFLNNDNRGRRRAE